MATEQDDHVFDQDLDDADSSPSSSSESHGDEEDDDDDDDEGGGRNGVLLADDEEEDEDDDEDSLLPQHHNVHDDINNTTETTITTTTRTTTTTTVVPTAVSLPSVPATKTDTTSVDPIRQRTAPVTMTATTAPMMITPVTGAIVSVPQQQQEEKKPLAVLDDSRRLFQRLWTDEDEIELLRGFLEYTSQRGGATSHQDTTLFYDQIKSKLQLEFNKNQLVEKLRRLKKKYRNVISKISAGKDFSFKSPHDQATFEISSKIWTNLSGNVGNSSNANAGVDLNFDDDGGGNGASSFNLNDADVRFDDSLQKNAPRSRKRSRPHASVRIDDVVVNNVHNANNINNSNNNNNSNSDNNDAVNVNVGGMIEEAVRSCVGPVFKELLSQVVATGSGAGFGVGVGVGVGIGGGGGSGGGGGGMMSDLVMNAMPLGFGGGEMMMMVDEKWRKQKILELEVYSKRLELVQEQIRVRLEELRSMGG